MTATKRLLKAVEVLVKLVTLYLLAVALAPGMSIPKQPIKSRGRDEPDETTGVDRRQNVFIPVDGAILSGWLFLPDDLTGPVACVVMGHGMGGTKDAGMAPYAVRFQEAGYAVLAFDYRYFGESEGEPRQLLWIPSQLADWAAVVEYARSREEIDPDRVALWGTSLSGGHVIVVAARDDRIACISAQCPAMDGRAGALMAIHNGGIINGLKLIVHGQRDLVRSWIGLSPHMVPLVGKPGTIALLATEDALDGYRMLVPNGFVNEACARIAIRIDKYRPVTHAKDVKCPALIQICDNDSLVPNGAAEETARILGDKAEVKRYPIGHFEIYIGDGFEQGVRDQIAFYQKHL